MSIRYILDTNTVSFYLRRKSEVLLARLPRTPAAQVALSVVTEMELRYGLAKKPSSKAAPLVEQFLAGITVLPLTSHVARHYASIRSSLESRGTPIGPLDMIIAAQALAIQATLVTNDLSEFRRVPSLVCEDWTQPSSR